MNNYFLFILQRETERERERMMRLKNMTALEALRKEKLRGHFIHVRSRAKLTHKTDKPMKYFCHFKLLKRCLLQKEIFYILTGRYYGRV